MTHPWERETGLEMPSGALLLPPDYPLRLSEFDIRPESQWQFFFGSLLAQLHGSGYRYTDFHPGNVGLDPRNGQFVILDPGGTIPTKLNPRDMVADFLIPYQTLSRDDFNAFLAGYIRRAYTDLDPGYEGYSQSVLNEVGGQILSTPYPGRPVLELDDILRQLHLTLGDDLSLTLSTELDPSRLDYRRLDDYLLVVFLLYVSGAASQLLEKLRAFLLAHLPSGDSSIHMGWLAFAQFFDHVRIQEGLDVRSRPGGSVADHIVSWLTTKSFSQFDEFRKYVALGQGEWRPNWAILAAVKDRPRGFAPLDYVRLVDKILAVTGDFSRIMDEHWLNNRNHVAKTRSLSFMQFYVVLLASTHSHPRWDEIRYVRLMRVFNGISWRGECDLDQINASNRPELYNYLRLSHSLLELELDIFKNSVTEAKNQGSGNPLWSLAWQALCRAREMLYATEPLLEEGQALRIIPEDVRYHLGLILADYGITLTTIAQSSMAGSSPFLACLMRKNGDAVERGSFLLELDWVNSLYDVVQRTPPPFPEFIEVLRTGREFFVSNPRIRKQRQS